MTFSIFTEKEIKSLSFSLTHTKLDWVDTTFVPQSFFSNNYSAKFVDDISVYEINVLEDATQLTLNYGHGITSKIDFVNIDSLRIPIEISLVDFINKNTEYIGGAISPGLHMRYQALYKFTENLPDLRFHEPSGLVGNDTHSSIHSGVVYGLVVEVNGIIELYEEQYSDLTVVLTGGDMIYLSKRLKNSIFAKPNFLAEGLNAILKYQIHE